jgi:cyanophycinase
MNKPKGKLIIIGGSVDRGSFAEGIDDLKRNLNFFEKGILKRITMESSKKNLSKIEVITTASMIPEEVGEEYIKAFAQLDVLDVDVLNIRTREEANSNENLERLKNADVVVFTGGDQLRLTSIFGGTAFHHLLCNKYQYKEGYIHCNGIKHFVVTSIDTRKLLNKAITILTAEFLDMRVDGNKIETKFTLIDELGNCE